MQQVFPFKFEYFLRVHSFDWHLTISCMPFKRGVKGFTAAGPLSALANWDNLVAIGGKNVLQILKVPEIDEECAITEEMDLGTAGLRNMNFSNNDVCWGTSFSLFFKRKYTKISP